MKGMGVLELMSLIWLHRLDVPLRRDVVLLAVSDEELSGSGAQHIVAEKWDEIGCSHLINEGGLGLSDMLFEGQTVFPISVGEKGALWLKMRAYGPPGHGSTPRPGEATEALLAAIEALSSREIDAEIHEALYELLANVGADQGGLSGFVMQRPLLVRAVVRPTLMDNPLTRAAMINTVHLTGFGGANAPNVVPSEVFALLDCRLQPGVSPAEMLAYVQGLVGPGIALEVLSAMEGNVSSWDDPLYEALSRQVAAEGFVAGPVISVGFTDSIYFRPEGVQAYGFVPFVLSGDDLGTFHGNNERVSVENMRRGLRMLLGAVIEVSAGT